MLEYSGWRLGILDVIQIPKQIKDFLPEINTNGFYHGYSIGFGVEINNLVNLKVIYYKYLKNLKLTYSFRFTSFPLTIP